MRLKMNLNDFNKRLQKNVKIMKGSENFLNPLYLFYKLTGAMQTPQGNVLKRGTWRNITPIPCTNIIYSTTNPYSNRM